MIVSIVASKEFSRQAKRLAKKYKSFVSDFAHFKVSIENIPIKEQTWVVENEKSEWLLRQKEKVRVAVSG